MGHIDLDERRKLRQATTVTAGGRDYTLPVFLPASLMSTMLALAEAEKDPAAGAQAVHDLFVILFGENADQAMKDVTLAEATDLLREVGQASAGESPASDSSSPTSGATAGQRRGLAGSHPPAGSRRRARP